MRKVTEATVYAFADRKPARRDNTSTDGQTLVLHGNTIARHFKDARGHEGIELSLAGWNTPTTRERLNGVLATMGYKSGNGRPYVGVFQHKGVPYIGQHGTDKDGAAFQERREEMPLHGWVRIYCPRDARLRGVNMTGPEAQRFAWFGGVKKPATSADDRPDFAFVLHGAVQEG